MEAVTAIGLASNIIQFIDVGYKVLKAAKELRASGKEASRHNTRLEFVTGEMKQFSLSIEQDALANGMTDDMKALLRLSSECQQCSDELLALLDKLKNRRSSSMLHSLRAAFRDARKHNEKAHLQENLNNLQKQMDFQLSKLARKETLEQLGSIASVSKATQEDVATTKKMVESIHQAMQATSRESKSHYYLQCILRISHDAPLKSQQSAILSSLGHDIMNYRFLEVAKAHAATFEWLLLDPRRKEELTMIRKTEFGALNHKAYQNQPTPAPPPLRESGDRFKHEANLAFNNWLRSGNGIFHISGKPGAGKSTLMKFICQSPKTQEYLGDWCGNDQLIFAKVFFWRQGQEDQKNLAGLTRSLLSQVLTACPELISVAFPRQWAETSKKAFIIQIEQGDVQEAFDRLLCDADSFKGRKFAFFVDGLDEYSGRHIDLVDKLMTWTSQHPANLKVCVASREWNEFMVGFSECPKLRIHHCTEQDITRYINDKFDGLCRHLTQFSAGDMKGLASEIVEKAEGVFVWVRLVLNAVEDGVLNGDGIPDLRVKVKTFPNELNALYQHLFDSIPESYRSKAFEALTLTRFWCWKKAIPLLQYWFLNEVIADPDFAMNMAIRDDQPDRDMLIQITRRQIYGRCKGFLEVCSSRIWGGPEDGVVTFMHSTVLEFLDSPHIKLTIDHTIGHVDFFYRTCQTFLATLKYGCPIEYYIRKDKFGPESSVYADISEITRFERLQAVDYKVLCQRPINPWFSSFLRMLEEVITKRFPTYETRKYAAPLLITCRSPTGFDHTQYNILLLPPNLIIQALAIENLIPEFLEQRDLGCFIENVHTLRSDRTLDIAQLLWGRLPLVPPISLSIQFIDLYERRYRIIRLLLGEGLNPNVKSSLWRGLTLFECCICYYLFSQDQEVGPLGLLELCLRYGATSHMCLIFGQTYRRKDGVKRKIKVGIHRAQDDLEEVDVIYVCATVPIVSFALQRNGVLSLHDVFKFWFPKDFERLHRLLDLQDDAGSTPSSYPIGGLDEHLSDDEHDCTQVELNGPIFPRAKSSWLLSDSYKIVENDKPDNRGSDAALFPIPKIH